MAASIQLVLRRSKQKTRGGPVPIYLRITKSRKTSFISTGIKVKPSFWNADRQEISASHELATALNKRLKRWVVDAQNEVLKGKSAEAVKKALVGSAGDFVRYAEAYIERLRTHKQFWEVRKYEVLLRKCKACLGKEIKWEHLDKSTLDKFESYLRTVRGNGPNTIRKEISRLRRLCNQAIKDGELAPHDDPFIRYDLPKGQRVEKRKLSISDIQSLAELDLVDSPRLRLSRDAFLLSYYGGGIRFGDLCVLKNRNILKGRVEYRAMKTGKLISVPLPEPAIHIISQYGNESRQDDYLLPLLKRGGLGSDIDIRREISSANAIANKNLKALAERAGMPSEGLSTHVARHSFADLARRVSGDIHAIMQTLGHSDINVTQGYLTSLDNDAVDRLTDQMWNSNQGPNSG